MFEVKNVDLKVLYIKITTKIYVTLFVHLRLRTILALKPI